MDAALYSSSDETIETAHKDWNDKIISYDDEPSSLFVMLPTLYNEVGLLWYQKADLEWELSAKQRGYYRIGPAVLMTGDLSGIFGFGLKNNEKQYITLYPRLVHLNSIAMSRRELFGLPGEKSPVDDPVYIVGTRDYQHWRPARYIHWKASARHTHLQEKVCEPTVQMKILIAVEVDGFAVNKDWEKFERILDIAASAAVRYDSEGYSIGLVLNGVVAGGGPSVMPVSRSPQQLHGILDILARVQAVQSEDIMNILTHGIDLPWGVSCVYMMHGRDDSTPGIEDFFSQRRIPVVFITAGGEHTEDISTQGRAYTIDDVVIYPD